jgi:hypothetical protein
MNFNSLAVDGQLKHSVMCWAEEFRCDDRLDSDGGAGLDWALHIFCAHHKCFQLATEKILGLRRFLLLIFFTPFCSSIIHSAAT